MPVSGGSSLVGNAVATASCFVDGQLPEVATAVSPWPARRQCPHLELPASLVVVSRNMSYPNCLMPTLQHVDPYHALQVLAVEVLWTPEDENDSYHRDELFEDYPELVTL